MNSAFTSITLVSLYLTVLKVYNGDTVEVLVPKGDNKIIKLEEMKKENGKAIDSAPSAQMIFTIRCYEDLKPEDMLIKSKEAK